ncbi:MAG: hypothetical protein ONB16_08300 [candidate division KSB1 bacterium]|nr:hypothetical protein [candidate division KSB1 bacterium]MDZ7319803.1 hypothetical protein [candidate division KSB1 bacterium]
MNKLEMKPLILILIYLIVGIGIFLLENSLKPDYYGSLLLTLLFWIAMVQGSIALVAVADLAQGKWIAPLKKHLLSVYPMILFIAILFLFISRQMSMYGWAQEPHGLWFNTYSFIIRNFILLVASFLCARKFAFESIHERPKKNIWAALFILSFVITQSLVGFDWVMSLEYPWISTLFGAYFFIEATYLGLATAAICCFFLLRKSSHENADQVKKTQRDVATFMFGFSLFWAGMFFAQFLTIWYGNIPEEVLFTSRRITVPSLRYLAPYVLGALFFVPFIVLLSRKLKTNPLVVSVIALIVMSGVIVERLFFLLPNVSIAGVIAGIEILLLLTLFILTINSRVHLLK